MPVGYESAMKSNSLRSLVAGAILLALVAVAAGCKNTARGAGKDIEKIGEKIQEKTR